MPPKPVRPTVTPSTTRKVAVKGNIVVVQTVNKLK
jgi:hypothetical protein